MGVQGAAAGCRRGWGRCGWWGCRAPCWPAPRRRCCCSSALSCSLMGQVVMCPPPPAPQQAPPHARAWMPGGFDAACNELQHRRFCGTQPISSSEAVSLRRRLCRANVPGRNDGGRSAGRRAVGVGAAANGPVCCRPLQGGLDHRWEQPGISKQRTPFICVLLTTTLHASVQALILHLFRSSL